MSPSRLRETPSPPRRAPFWINTGALVVLVAMTLAGLTVVHVWSGQQQVAHWAVTALRSHTALEQEDVLDVRSRVAVFRAKANADLSLLETTMVGTPSGAVIARLAAAYQATVSLQETAVQRGAPAEAALLHATVGDPAFSALDGELKAVQQQAAAGAERGVTGAFVASLGMVIFSAALIFLFALLARRRDNRVVAAQATAVEVAHESRLASAQAASFRSLFDDNPQPMFVTRQPIDGDDAPGPQILSVNAAAVHLYGYTRAELLALSLADLCPPEDHERALADIDAVRRGCTRFDNIRQRTSAGTLIDVELDIRETVFDGHPAMIVCTNNVTDRVRLQRELEHQAFHDALTGLPNRSLFNDRLEHAHQRLHRGGGRYAVLMLDLDNFKTVNDSLGHAAGDALLMEVSQRLAGGIRPGDTAARLGGDEFAILLEDVAESADPSVTAARLHRALREPCSVGGHALTITATIGIASSSGEGAASDVVRNADVALYVGKANGKDRDDVFSDHMHAVAVERMTLEQDLRVGIGRGELMLLYQPKVDAHTGALTGVEALVRWNHPTRGLVSPAVFIPVAEQSGLVNEIDGWVLHTACHQAQRWATSAVGPIPMAVNASGRSLSSGQLLGRVGEALRHTGLNPALLEIELTESAAIPQGGEALAVLQELRDLGVRIAIDDFGTGYSVLSRLQGFPVDTLKIDLSFVRAIVSAREKAPIVDAMISMGLSLGLKVVAEGVETEVQRAYLARRGCAELQGYLFSWPIAAEQVAERAMASLTGKAGTVAVAVAVAT
ncbi:MAG: putative bifunctional diguanylate cyclase/phosphodiesterase [Candidatus Dormibacteria bacterium]